jgi:hypothetical protein
MARELLKDLIYGEQLVSAGCKVDFAVGLTYSLNLEAMLTVPLAFGDLGELDSNVKLSPAFLLEGIRRSSDKIALFCNKGGIHVPSETRTIYSLLESSIFEVQDGNDIFSNFHPKIWLVKEIDKDGDEWLKLSVMSRNLDFSTCLDICCSIRGHIERRRSLRGVEKHKPLKDMLLWLSEYAPKTKADKVCQLAEQLDYVDRFKLDMPFQTEDTERNEDEGYDFFPFVYGKEEFSTYGNYLKKYLPGDRILVVSPFIDITTLSWLTSRKKDYNYESRNSILITRKEYVTQEVFELFEQVWVPNDTMLDNTTANVDLHAKMYLTQRLTGDDLGYTLYLGSANATVNAFNKNVEFLLRLHYKRTTNDRIKELLEEITSEHRFVVMDAPNPEASNTRPSNEKELALKRAVGCLRKAVIKTSNKDGLYDIDLSVRGKYDGDIQIRPLQCKGLWQPISNQVFFKELSTHLLSEFYVIRIPSDDEKFIELVAKVKTSGMPADRDESIYQSIVTKKEELLDYVAFMLSDRPSEFFFEQQMMKESKKYADGANSNTITMPLYEQLLKTASTNPEQITEVQKFIKKMKQDIVPEELTKILQMFQNVSKQLVAL